TADIDFSNSIDLLTTIPKPATTAAPINIAPLLATSKPLVAVEDDVPAVSPKPLVAAAAFVIPETYPAISAWRMTDTVRLGTLLPSISQVLGLPDMPKGR